VMPGPGALARPGGSPQRRMRAMAWTGAMAHGVQSRAWSASDSFMVAGRPGRPDIDCAGRAQGGAGKSRSHRSHERGSFPRPTSTGSEPPILAYARHGLSAARSSVPTGALRIAKAYSVLECGQGWSPKIVPSSGAGWVSLGRRYALIETLPLYE